MTDIQEYEGEYRVAAIEKLVESQSLIGRVIVAILGGTGGSYLEPLAEAHLALAEFRYWLGRADGLTECAEEEVQS